MPKTATINEQVNEEKTILITEIYAEVSTEDFKPMMGAKIALAEICGFIL